jgi:hypothetical protein
MGWMGRWWWNQRAGLEHTTFFSNFFGLPVSTPLATCRWIMSATGVYHLHRHFSCLEADSCSQLSIRDYQCHLNQSMLKTAVSSKVLTLKQQCTINGSQEYTVWTEARLCKTKNFVCVGYTTPILITRELRELGAVGHLHSGNVIAAITRATTSIHLPACLQPFNQFPNHLTLTGCTAFKLACRYVVPNTPNLSSPLDVNPAPFHIVHEQTE